MRGRFPIDLSAFCMIGEFVHLLIIFKISTLVVWRPEGVKDLPEMVMQADAVCGRSNKLGLNQIILPSFTFKEQFGDYDSSTRSAHGQSLSIIL